MQDELAQLRMQVDQELSENEMLDQDIARLNDLLLQQFVQRYPLLRQVSAVSLSFESLARWLAVHDDRGMSQ
jgi:hypothetical protein